MRASVCQEMGVSGGRVAEPRAHRSPPSLESEEGAEGAGRRQSARGLRARKERKGQAAASLLAGW